VGTWGTQPWENDEAADWFGSLWVGTDVVERVDRGLEATSGQVALAAVWLCVQLCRVYVWPIDSYEDTLARAVRAVDRLLAGEDEDGLLDMWDDAEVTAQVEQFRAALVERQARAQEHGEG
jgi:hypothetical protein